MKTILRRAAVAAAVVLTVGLVGAPAAVAGGGHGGGGGRTILSAELAGSLTTDPVLFQTVAPGGADWVIGDGEARLRHDGRLDVKVEGLVLTSTGANPVTQVSASVGRPLVQGPQRWARRCARYPTICAVKVTGQSPASMGRITPAPSRAWNRASAAGLMLACCTCSTDSQLPWYPPSSTG